MILMLGMAKMASSQDFFVEDYGAIADGHTMNTISIQKCINDASKNGGGKVVLSQGTYLCGSIILRNNIELHISRNSTLLGSENPSDYIRLHKWPALVLADSANNVAISGKGIIDGQGDKVGLAIDSLFYIGKIDSSDYNFTERRPKVNVRPQLIEFVRCSHTTIKDVNLKDAASWVQTYYLCSNLRVQNVTVNSDAYWNNDGIDIVDCEDVLIEGCFVNSSDDGICLKSYGAAPQDGRPLPYPGVCKNISITNCKVRSSASAVKLGTASYGGFEDITIEDIEVFDTFRSAIALESYGNGYLRNVTVRNINATNTGNAIFIRSGQRIQETFKPGILEDILIENVKVKVPATPPDAKYQIRGPALPFFHNVFPASITGLKDQHVKNIVLRNITIIYPGGGNAAYAHLPLSRLDAVPEAEEKYPEFSMFGELPAWAFYVRHTSNLTLENVKVKVKSNDYRPAFVFDDVNHLDLINVTVQGKKKPNDFIFQNVEEFNQVSK